MGALRSVAVEGEGGIQRFVVDIRRCIKNTTATEGRSDSLSWFHFSFLIFRHLLAINNAD